MNRVTPTAPLPVTRPFLAAVTRYPAESGGRYPLPSAKIDSPVTRYPAVSGGRYPLPGRIWRPLPITHRKKAGVTRYLITLFTGPHRGKHEECQVVISD